MAIEYPKEAAEKIKGESSVAKFDYFSAGSGSYPITS
jgi:hypothetical protein